MLWVRLTRPIHETGLLLADAFGLAVFTVYGTQVALQHDLQPGTAVIMGVITAVGGGVLRDIICNEVPLIFQKEIYAIACIAGSLVFIGLREVAVPDWLGTSLAMLVVLMIRLAAIHWKLSLPRFHLLDRD
ncbi:hypothetical protein D3C81_1764830 [compost metagenome]